MKHVALGEVAEFINGAAFKPTDWGESGRRIIRIQNLNDPSKPFNLTHRDVGEKYLVPTGTLLVSWSASLGVFEWNEPDTAVLNQHIFKVVPDTQRINQNYLRHMLANALVDMSRHHRGSTMVHVNRKEFLGTTIPLPPLDEQRRIAGILDQADALHRLRARALDKLKTLGQAFFHEIFGDPATNPKGWPIGAIGDLLAEAKYGSSGKANSEGRGLPMLRMGNLTYDGRIDLSDLKHIELNEKEFEKYTTRPGDILFNRTNSKELVGKTAVVTLAEPMAIAGYLVRGRANKRGNTHYISGYLNSTYGKAVLRGMCKNIVGMANINAKEFQSISIAIPPVELQSAYELKLSRLAPEEARLQKSMAHFRDLFTSLQHRAFRGDL